MTAIRTVECPQCTFCKADGRAVYRGLRDTLFGAPGEWHLKQCPNPLCGVLWLDPMPHEEDIGEAYREYVTHSDKPAPAPSAGRRLYQWVKEGYWASRYGYGGAHTSVWKRLLGLGLYLDPARRAYADFAVMYLPARPSGRLLDIGCGSGALTEALGRMGWTVEGVDTDARAIDTARRKGLRVHLGPVEGLHLPDNGFDAIIMSHVIEHVYDPMRLLEECRRILAPGGNLVVITPNADSLGHRMYKDAWRNLEPPRHLHIFTPPALGGLAARAGFHVVRLTTSIREADGIFGMSSAIRRTGTYAYRTRQPKYLWWWARTMQLVEWAAMKVDPDLGEELVLLATKP